MPDTDVLYADVKFKNITGKSYDSPSPSHDTTYSQVNIVKTQLTTEHSGSQQQTYRRSKVTPERVAVVALSIFLIVAVSALIFTQVKSIDCGAGWEQHRDKCYYFTPFTSSWNISRTFCTDFKADLVKIDSEEEQSFLLNKVKTIMNFHEDKFWIGLTDSQTEGTWLWVDGSSLDENLQFWWNDGKKYKEPDNWKGEEDCVRIGELGPVTELQRWLDAKCTINQRSICAKPIKGRQ